ncbi:hypothetical protein K8R30_01180 [archaeon]|nr:hypothetical protein [archaeon]
MMMISTSPTMKRMYEAIVKRILMLFIVSGTPSEKSSSVVSSSTISDTSEAPMIVSWVKKAIPIISVITA